jgi:diguanylate cyclase (GGDEF)-like protein
MSQSQLLVLVAALLAMLIVVGALGYWRLRKQRPPSDALTGLPMRGAFWSELEQACAKAQKRGSPLAVVMADIDRLTAINDFYGSAAGDSVLRHFSGLLRKAAGKGALVARLGGDVFAVILPGVNANEGRAIAHLVSSSARATPCPLEPDTIAYSVSVGMAALAPGEDAGNLMHRADQALDAARRAARSGAPTHDEPAAPGLMARPRVRVRPRVS